MSAPLPTVHLNGTGRKMLTDGYTDAWLAINTAVRKLAKVEFHPRDYYVNPDPEAYNKARAQRDQQFADLRRIQEELEAIINHID